MRIKICGITRGEDAKLAAHLGAWALGFIFYPPSPRFIQPETAALIKKDISTPAIGVFVDQMPDILNIAHTAHLNGVQLHGRETPEDCKHIRENFGGFIIKAFHPKTETDLDGIANYTSFVDYILIDAAGDQHGGTGNLSDWDLALIAKKSGIPLILAGGITAGNVCTAYRDVNPYALDLSSGIEDAPGIKNHDKMTKLFDTSKGCFS